MALYRGEGGAGTADITTTPITVANGGTGASTTAGARSNLGLTATGQDTTYAFRSNNLSDLSSASTARTNLGLGTAATTASTDYATAAQGALADSATQPGDLATVATTGDYDDLSNKPSLFSGSYNDLTNKPTIPANIDDLGDVTITSAPNGQVLSYNGTAWVNSTASGSGTVTSVDMTVPTGLSVSGGPVTSSGTFAVTYSAGYSIPTTTKQSNWDDSYTFVAAFPSQTSNSGKYLTTNGSALSWGTLKTSNWDTAYGWGNHASAGYLTTETYTGTVTSVAASVPTGFTVSGSPITSTGTLAITYSAGYALPTTASQTNWDTAYGWGNYASAGYLTSSSTTFGGTF